MEGSRVLKQLNRPDSCTERDVVKPKKGAKAGSTHSSRHPAAATENSEPSEVPAGGSRDQAASGLPAGLAAKQQSLKQQQGQQQQGVPMNGQGTDGTAAAGSDPEQEAAAKRDAAPASSPSLLAAAAAKLAAGGAKRVQQSKPMQQQQQDYMHSSDSMEGDADSEDAADDIEDSDLEQPVKKQKAASGTAAARRPTRHAAQQQPSYVEAVDADSESGASADDISEDEDSPSEQQQPLLQQRSSRPQRQQKQQPKQQEQPATGRARRAAAVAAVDRMRGAEATVQQQEQAVRRSTRTRRAATESPDDSGDDVPVVRPRRAAAAAAKQATAAALAAEAAPMAWASQHGSDSSDLGTPDASDAEVDEAAQGMSSDGDDMGGDGSDGSGASDDDDMEGGSGSWGTGSKWQRSRAQPTRQQPKRGRGNRAVVVDDSDEPGSDAGDDEGSPEAADASEEGGDLPMPLDAFRFNGKTPAAATGGKRGAAKRRGSSDSGSGGSGGSREGSEEPDAAAQAAALQEEEELSRDVLNASEFAPVEVEKLSRGDDVDKCLDVRYEEDDSITVLIKLVGKSYRHAVWVPAAAVEKKRPHLLRNFLSRQAGGDIDTDWAETNNINPAWYKIDRIISEYKHARKAAEYCVKWCGLEYSEATWETEEEICRDGAGKVALARFKRWSTPAHLRPTQSKRPRQELVEQRLLPDFKNGRKLRDYQEESLHWMINNYRGQIVSGKWKPRNCILGDEMGLGKTAQSIAVISWLKQYAGASAPVLVVAPLTTLGHWKREIETWTDLNVVLYAGSAQDRQLIREFEFFYPKHKTAGPRFNVLLSSYETVLKDKPELRKLHFEALIVDEAHRLKNQKSATRQALQDMSARWLLMLSGTPVQNNMRELQGLMSLLDEELYGDPDEFLEQFGSDAPTLEQIRALQAALAPVLLRRMKEDVEDLPEKEEVVIWVELTPEQRRYYRALYSQQIGALLGGVSNKNLPGMRNLAMELRKLCCHPFLCDGLEDDMTLKWQAQAAAEAKTQKEREIENYTRASGKMLLLHKLLPKLRAEGRQVLIFSQFKMMLDVIQDYLTACDFPFERIDGDTKHSARQAAIDRFMAVKDRQRSKTPTSRAASPSPAAAAADGSSEQGSEGQATGGAAGSSGQQAAGSSRGASPSAVSGQEDADGPFVFLLSTRAGGQGITLTSADTVIIYDSDWNPQNDLQAMARCHRIGQEKEVTVYRLVSKNTYEQQLFETSSRKMGLDEAILGFAGSGENPENDAARIEQLLRLGAHAIMGGTEDKGDAAGEDKGFAAEDIEQILIGRSEKRQLGSRKGNTFSIAHFGDGGGELEPEQEEAQAAEVVPKSAKDFWTELLPEAAAEHAARANRKEPEVLGPRRRKQVDYREANMGARSASSSDFTGTEDGDEEEGKGASGGRGTKRAAEGDAQQGGKKAKKKADESSVMDPELGRAVDIWKTSHVDVVRDALLRFGPDQMDRVVEQCVSNECLKARQPDEIEQMAKGLIVALGEMGRLAPALQQEEKAAKAAVVAAAAAGDLTAQTASKSHGNLSVQYIKKMRDALIQGGVEAKLPPACAKALLSSNCVRTMGRAPATLIQQLDDHRKVHQAMVAAGLVKDSSKPAAAAAAAGSSQQQQQQDASASTPGKSQPAAAAANGEAPKRTWVGPRVLLKGSKGVPLWWRRDHDDLLLQGCYAYGYSAGSRLNSIVEAILQDPVYGFTSKCGLDPEALVVEKAVREANMQQPVPVQVQVPGGDGQLITTTAMQRPKPVVNPAALAAAKEKKQQLQQQHPGIELLGTVDMHRLVSALVQRLKRVRTALLDPHYVEPATPSKQLHMVNTTAAPARPAAPAAAAAAGTGSSANGVQQRLQLAPNSDGSLTYKGRKVIGGGLPHAAAAVVAAAAAAGGPARTPPGAVPPNFSPEAARQMMINQQRALAQQNGRQLAQVASTAAALAMNNVAMQAQLQARKRLLEEQVNSAAKRPNSNNPSPGAAQQQQRPMPSPQQVAMAVALNAELNRRAQMHNQRDMLQRQQQAQQQQQQQQRQQHQPEVVELLDDDSSNDEQPLQAVRQQPPAATPAAGAAVPAAPVNPPSSGLEVRRVPAGADLSQEQSVDEPEGAAAAAAAAAGTASSSGKHMQQLLGERQPDTSPKKGAASKAAAAEHPVYGTPAHAAAAAAAATAGRKRKQGKDDPSQRRIESFFAASGPK